MANVLTGTSVIDAVKSELGLTLSSAVTKSAAKKMQAVIDNTTDATKLDGNLINELLKLSYVRSSLASLFDADNNGLLDKTAEITAAKEPLAEVLAVAKAGATTPTVVSNTTLSLNVDNLVGTSGNDVFKATILNNANTLQSGDVINGGDGVDRLAADIGTSQAFSITPETTGVEQLAIRAQAVAIDSNNNNMLGTTTAQYSGASQVDAERMVGLNWIESNNSRADVVVEDVRILPTQITKDITIAMVETDPGNVDFGVYFDQYSLRNVSSSTSTLNLQVLDTRSALAGKNPLETSPYNTVTFVFNGKTQTLDFVSANGGNSPKTYAELLSAVNKALSAAGLDGKVTASLGSNFTAQDTKTGVNVVGTELVLASTNGTLALQGGTAWGSLYPVPADSGYHTYMTTGSSSQTGLVTSKIILDDVGRGSTGGDLVVGGLSVGDTSTSKGVERFEIEVRDNSKLQTINSTNNTLKEVTIVNGETSSSSFAYVATAKGAGNLTVNGNLASAPNSAQFPNAVDGSDNTALPGSAAQHNAYGFSDVRLIDGSAMTGKLAFTAEITGASVAKYLNLKDQAADQPAADNVAFQYSGGSNNDTMSVTVDAGLLATASLSGREDFSLTLNGNGGDDAITLDIGGLESGAWYVDQKLVKNISINGGDGNDTIKTPGAGDVAIDTGAGNDTVYADNSGKVDTTWLVAAANTTVADLQSATPVATSFLYQGKVTVTFAAPDGVTNAVATGNGAAAAALANGFEATADIPTGNNYAVNQLMVNQAIKKAINGDAVLNKLLVAEDGPGHTLTVKSLIDGTSFANDLIINVSGADLTKLSTTDQSTVLSAYKKFATDSTATVTSMTTAQTKSVTDLNAVKGMGANQVVVTTSTFSTAESDNTITVGTGDDVLVLGTGEFSNDTVVFNGYDLGKKTIVNFESNVDTWTDYLNFGSYLTTTAGTAESQKAVATTFNTDSTVEANSVTVLTPTFTATDTFAGLDAAKLLTAVNTAAATGNYAGITAATLDAVSYTGTSALASTGKAVVMVENSANKGEYKAFELSFVGTSTDKSFSDAKLIATVDLGASATSLATSTTTSAPSAAGGVSATPTTPTTPTANTVVVPVATAAAAATGTTAGTAAADVFTFDVGAAKAQTNNTQVSVSGFAAGVDKLTLDLPTASGVTTLGALNGQQGVVAQADPFTGNMLVTFGADANGDVVSLTLVGVTNAALVDVTVI